MPEPQLDELELEAAFRTYLVDAPTDVSPTELAHRLATEHPAHFGPLQGWTLGVRPAAAWLTLLALLLLALVTGLLVAGSWHPERAIVVAPTPNLTAALGRWVSVTGAEAIATDPRLVRAAGGRVLVVEGTGSSCAPRQAGAGATAAWVYDPATGAFSPTQPLPEPLAGGWGFTMLADGRVLAVGGLVDDRPVGHAWIWDPEDGAWDSIASLGVARAWPNLLALPDGRVVALGGAVAADAEATSYVATNTVEVLDPTLSRWARLGDAPVSGRVVVGADGRLLTFPVGSVLLESGELAWASDETWGVTLWAPDRAGSQRLGPSLIRTDRDPALALPDRTVLTIDELGNARVFDRTAGWRSAGRLQVPRLAASFTVLSDGRVLVAGGLDGVDMSSAGFDTAELFDPRTGTSSLIEMPMSWVSPDGALRLDDGSVLLAGTSRPSDLDQVACTTHGLRWVP